MNFLAHLFLADLAGGAGAPAGARAGLIVGGFVADFVKGRAVGALPADVRRGVELHRRIDAFTDCHPAVAASKRRFPAPWRRYAGILVDVLYDHCLASRWHEYSPTPLPAFVRAMYGVLGENQAGVPDDARLRITHMVFEDWLTSYAQWSGVATALDRISRRLKRPVELGRALDDVRHDADGFFEDFRQFFPELIAAARG